MASDSITEVHKTQVDLKGLMEVLGKNLYSTPAVAIREIVQNSHDACIRRQLEDSTDFTPFIRVSVIQSQQCLQIEDNGAGLTKEEIIKYLATVGSGYTRQLRQEFQEQEQEHQGQDHQDSNLIGYFGLGFLSTYVVSDRVEVETSSYQSADLSWHFSSSGGERYSIDSAQPRSVGTQVTLHLSEDYRLLADLDYLHSLLQRYCCMLKIPIFLSTDNTPINNTHAPWLLDHSVLTLQKRKQSLSFAAMFEQRGEPLCVINITPTETCNVNGIIWIQSSSSFATSDFRNVHVFIRDMHITDEARDLLPLWAGFVSCVINTTELTPTASREDIQKDTHYERLQHHIATSLVSGLQEISQKEPENWQRIISRHNQSLLGAAVSDDKLFKVLQHDLKVPTSEGDKSLPQLCRHQKKIYIKINEKNGHEDILLKSQMIPVVSGYLFAAAAFCQNYGQLNGIPTFTLGTKEGNIALFSIIKDQPSLQEILQSHIALPGEEIIISRFKPDYIPLVLVMDEDVLLKKRIESDERNAKIGAAALLLAKNFTQSIDHQIQARIYVNSQSPVIQAIPTLTNKTLPSVCQLLRSLMVAMTGNINPEAGQSMATELQKFSSSILALTNQK